MNSEEFNFEPITESGITYYIIPKGTVLYHGSNNISTPEQLQERRHTFFALTNEYAGKYAKETGNVFRFATNKELRLIAIDKSNETLYKNASDKIQKILDENYGFFWCEDTDLSLQSLYLNKINYKKRYRRHSI